MLTQKQRLFVEAYLAFTRAFIIILLANSSPSAIIWGVSLRVIDTIKRVFRGRFLSHIGKERFKRMKPFIANCYTGTAISLIIFGSWIQAARFHSDPRYIFRAIGLSVSRKQSTGGLALQASTGLSFAISQLSLSGNRIISALAQAMPISLFMCTEPFLDHGESPELLPC